MMHRHTCYVLLFLMLGMVGNVQAETPSCRNAYDCYWSKNYQAAAIILEKELGYSKDKKGAPRIADDITDYQSHMFLAHILAWRLAEEPAALKHLTSAMELRESSKKLYDIPPLPLLYMAEIHEKMGDLPRAVETYRRFLDALSNFGESKTDREFLMILDELDQIAKYRIDGVHIKQNDGQRALKKIKACSTLLPALAPYLQGLATPFTRFGIPGAGKDLTSAIEQSTNDLASMVFFFTLVVPNTTSGATESRERNILAYVDKFGSDYYSIYLRSSLLRHYKKAGMSTQAQAMLEQLYAIEASRGIKIISDRDTRFETPESAWSSYRDALRRGDLEETLECAYQPRRLTRAELKQIDRKKMMSNGAALGDIELISIDGDRAKYRRRVVRNGQEKIIPEFFTRFDGEWKVGGLAY